ncbi:MAG: NADH-quinone oxidoreductase subunit J [Candidatus Dadabacteria bacterium]|nr:MAG: NADH-quinone oxidoreductase subunit J [Candidatus Dadabacteria bacterium]
MALAMFFVFAAFAVLGGIGVILARNPIHSALSLVGTMVSLAVIYLLHHAEFIFAIQLMVYAGAIMTLIVFVIMLLDIRQEEAEPERLAFGRVIGMVLAGLMVVVLLVPVGAGLMGKPGDMTEEVLARVGSVQFLSEKLFTGYLLPFEIASVLLLVGLVGAVALAKKRL